MLLLENTYRRPLPADAILELSSKMPFADIFTVIVVFTTSKYVSLLCIFSEVSSFLKYGKNHIVIFMGIYNFLLKNGSVKHGMTKMLVMANISSYNPIYKNLSKFRNQKMYKLVSS